jgi:hypothetical protein
LLDTIRADLKKDQSAQKRVSLAVFGIFFFWLGLVWLG